MTNCLLCGVGGQGTVLASKLIALSAIQQGLSAKTAETIGMAQRGGSVVSHVRIGDDIYAPMISVGEADMIIGFEPGEAVRNLNFLKPGGTVVVNTKAVIPTTASLGLHYDGQEMLDYLKTQNCKVIEVDGDRICRQLQNVKVLNVVLLGAAASTGELGLTLEQLEEAIKTKLPEKFKELNCKALYSCVPSLAQQTERTSIL